MSEWRQGYVSAALSPRETRKLVLGRGSYVGDLTAPGLLHAAFVRSPHAMKGMAEGSVMGASAAISNAVADALAPLGVDAGRQPFTAGRLAQALRREARRPRT